MTLSSPGQTALFWPWRRRCGSASIRLLNRSLSDQTTRPLLSFLSALPHEKVAASSLFSDTVIIVLQLSALIIVYKYYVFMGNC